MGPKGREDTAKGEELAKVTFWWSTAGIVFSIAIFLISTTTNTLTTEQLQMTIHSTSYAAKNDEIIILDPFIKAGVLAMQSPDLPRQAYAEALKLTQPTLSSQEVNEQLSKINSIDDYVSLLTNRDPIQEAEQVYDHVAQTISILNEWEDLLFLLLVISQILAAIFAFKLFRETSEAKTS